MMNSLYPVKSGCLKVLPAAACVLSLLVSAGCQSNGSSKKPAAGGQSRSDGQNARAAMASVAVSSLRERAIQIVEETASSPDASLRANAAEAASHLPARLRSVLEGSLADQNPGVRAVGAFAVGKAKVAALSKQAGALALDPVPVVKACGIYAAIRTGAAADRSPLAEMLLKDPSPSAKRQAVDVLGGLEEPSAKSLLKAAAKERFPELPPAQTRLLQLQIAAALVRLGDDSQRPVVRAALYPSQPDELEAAVLAVQILGELEDKEAAAQLVSIAEYKDRAGKQYPPEVRLAVAASLAQLGMPEGSFVAEQYVSHPAPMVRAQVAFVYGVTKGRQNGARLEQLLNAPEPQVRIAAAAAVLKSLSRQ
ncbi:MAG: hypothetical protein NTV94_17690 [Planctomycetota bacterium]|nr:hypothetical protein [Planctomycetota bacterium]